MVKAIIGKEYAPSLRSSPYNAFKNIRIRTDMKSWPSVAEGFYDHA